VLEKLIMREKEAPVLHKNIARASFLVYLTIMGAVAARAQEAAPTILPVPQAITAGGGGDDAEHRQTPMLQHRKSRYQLHSSDVLELSFPFTPEFNQAVTIQPDGYITLRGVESIKVDGKTIPELVDLLRSTYAKILHDPVINVELKDFEKPYFIVGGEVGHPGKFDLRGDTSVAQAVAIAGGLNASAKHSQILVFHRVPDGWMQVKKVNLKKMLKEANLEEDAQLQAGDFLFVPKNTFSKIERFIPTSSVGMYTNPILH
jgi:polysaccharide export outer membrane protein